MRSSSLQNVVVADAPGLSGRVIRNLLHVGYPDSTTSGSRIRAVRAIGGRAVGGVFGDVCVVRIPCTLTRRDRASGPLLRARARPRQNPGVELAMEVSLDVPVPKRSRRLAPRDEAVPVARHLGVEARVGSARRCGAVHGGDRILAVGDSAKGVAQHAARLERPAGQAAADRVAPAARFRSGEDRVFDTVGAYHHLLPAQCVEEPRLLARHFLVHGDGIGVGKLALEKPGVAIQRTRV